MDKLKKCPFCKGEAELIRGEMWNGSHGYHGSYEYYVRCNNPECKVKPKAKSYDTIYDKNEDMPRSKAIDAWNIRG